MQFIRHTNLEGLHAPFSPSQSSWLRYTDEKIQEALRKKKAAALGTKLHAWAKETIDLGIKQPKSNKTLYMYVNDGIGYKMSTEVVLYYSDYFFGTADCISFRNGVLRIHDLKTGETPVTMEQLEIYAALFILEYKIKAHEIKEIELRIYQQDKILYHKPAWDEIVPIMDKIVHLDKILQEIEF